MRDIITKILVNRYIIIFAVVGLLLLMLIIGSINKVIMTNVNNTEYSVDETNVQVDKLSTHTDRGDQIKVSEALENEDIMKQFVDFCNEGKTKEAYELLSEDCKEVLYPTEEDFIKKYFNYYFKEEKEIGTDLAYNESGIQVYRIKLYKNSIETGEIDREPFSDIYSIVSDSDGNKKLSINKFITTIMVDKAEEYKGIKITLLRRDIFEDEEYDTFEIDNTTTNRISLRTGKGLRTIYMESESGSTYVAPGNEINDLDAIVKAKNTKKIRIRFNRGYRPSNRVNAIVFSDIVPDYDAFEDNPKNLKTVYTIKVKI